MPAESSDEQLLAAFLNGRSQALGELARRYERALLGLAAGVLGGRRDLACDAVQETWVRVIRFGRQFSGASSFKTWVYRITVNQCRSLAGTALPGGADPLDVLPAKTPAPDCAAAAHAQDDAVRRAVAGLDEPRRLVVLLCYHAGLTHTEAAEILDVPLGTLKSRLHAALVELRQQLTPEIVT